MEVITIDSSDDENNPVVADKSCRVITPREFQSDSGSVNSSVSSNDSIWGKGITFCSRAKNAADADAAFVVSEPEEDDGGSSVSSNDSIWEKVGILSLGRDTCPRKAESLTASYPKGGDQAVILGHEAFVELNRNAPTDKDACRDVCTYSCFKNDTQSDDSSAPLVGSAHDTAVSSAQNKTAIHQQKFCGRSSTNDDSSTASSVDSILDKAFFEQRRPGASRINSYYDYCRHYSNKPSYNNPSNTCATTQSRKTAITSSLPPEVPLPVNAEWRIVLLMDHREFGCSNNFLQMVEKRINAHFGGAHSEITTLPSADYLYVARLISNSTGEIMDERVLDMVIERKNVQDVCQCLVTDSKKYKPLSFFEAQMYKLQNCGVSKKLFVMEGDEDKAKNLFRGAKSQAERERRLKRVKTLRLQLANGEFEGVDLVCTKDRHHTVKFLIHQLESFQQSFDPRRPPTKTREQLKRYINRQMKAPTFLEYLRLRSIPSIGDAKAMKVIMDPNLDWDKTFLSPSCSKISKSTLEDKATFWKAPSPTQTKTAGAISTQDVSGEASSSDVVKPKVKSREARNKKSNTMASNTKSSHAASKTISSLFNQNACNGGVAIRFAAGTAAEIIPGTREFEEKESTSI
ncbi:hypothetical protein HJC23_004775 [Cyclotella cryptica]|uniref:Crossover junction endonuclease MUS81 n=1 Tax=Cyclotella cryptica TaxID=29204 RepID=A0ABD3PXL2_9STRA|eukprot:CCRYP_010392-RE/>CCRYP_010392-RE protein AED:0.18 eAED:0.18 QI:159/1/0.88/1/0.25/0.22/9/4821/629